MPKPRSIKGPLEEMASSKKAKDAFIALRPGMFQESKDPAVYKVPKDIDLDDKFLHESYKKLLPTSNNKKQATNPELLLFVTTFSFSQVIHSQDFTQSSAAVLSEGLCLQGQASKTTQQQPLQGQLQDTSHKS